MYWLEKMLGRFRFTNWQCLHSIRSISLRSFSVADKVRVPFNSGSNLLSFLFRFAFFEWRCAGWKTKEHATAFSAMPLKISTVPWTPKYARRTVIKCGAIIGPKPVIVHDIPVAIRRRSLKYVFSARELADVVMPIPEPAETMKKRFRQ